MYGNVSESGDVCADPGKSSLFFLTARHPGIDLLGDRVLQLVKHDNLCRVRCARDGP